MSDESILDRPLLRPEEASAIANVPVDELCSAMPFYRIGARTIRFSRRDVGAYMRWGSPAFTRGGLWVRDEGAKATGLVYFIEAVGTDRVKIGWTAKSVHARRRQLQRSCPFLLRVITRVPGDTGLERKAHRMFSAERVELTMEWFVRSQPLERFIDEVLAIAEPMQ